VAHSSPAEAYFQGITAFSALLRGVKADATRVFWHFMLCFTNNPCSIMKLSYNFAFVPDGTRIVCYNRASFFGWIAFSHGFGY
jgi:hypothetical protein